MSKITETGFTVEIHLSKQECERIAKDLAERICGDFSKKALKATGYTSQTQVTEMILNDPSFSDSLEAIIRGFADDRDDDIWDSIVNDNVPVVVEKIYDQLEEIE
jgi:hypothetical protein